MESLLDIISSRLKVLFADENDDKAANKLHMSHGNLNNIKNGRQTPTIDTLKLISEKYHVSVDWILGLKDDRDVNAINLDSLDYRQIFMILDKLYENKTLVPAQPTEKVLDFGDEDTEDDNVEQETEPSVSTEGVDYDLLRVNDPTLSFMLRRRMKLIEYDPSLYNDWVEKHLPEYKGLPIFECSDEMKEYLSKHRTGNSDGDWSTCLTEYFKKKKEKKDNKDG